MFRSHLLTQMQIFFQRGDYNTYLQCFSFLDENTRQLVLLFLFNDIFHMLSNH